MYWHVMLEKLFIANNAKSIWPKQNILVADGYVVAVPLAVLKVVALWRILKSG